MEDIVSTEKKINKKTLITIIIGVFAVYIIIGLAIPAIPLHVNGTLRMGSFLVGSVAGAQFAASFIFRIWSGKYADRNGGKKAMITGLFMASVAGFLYFLSLVFISQKNLCIVMLLIGRAVLGAAESCIISGALLWGMSAAGKDNTGKVMVYVGTAMYLAFAIGAPAGTFIFSNFGFSGIAYGTIVFPLLTLILISKHEETVKKNTSNVQISRILKKVWIPGLGLALSSLGFGAVTTFIVLFFKKHDWSDGWVALTLFASLFVVTRLLLGHLSDKWGGAKVAVLFAVIEMSGLFLVGFATSATWAFIGAAITGIGYSLVFPGLGVEAVKSAPEQSKGLATGLYTAFLDLALGIANPLLGIVADSGGISNVFKISAILVLGSVGISLFLLLNRRRFSNGV